MKRSLLFKLILCYIICISFIFLIIETVGSKFSTDSFDRYILTDMQKECTSLNEHYLAPFLNGEITYKEFQNELSSFAEFTNSTIWFVNAKGNVIFDTSGAIESDTKVLSDDAPELFEQYTGTNYKLENYIENPSYYCSTNFTKGTSTYYIIMFKENSIDEDYRSDMMVNLTLIAVIFCPIILLIFVLIYFLTIHPVHKITKAASEYSKGNFNYPLEINANDEYHELGTAIKYMAGEMNNLDDYQRKFIGNISHDFRSPLTSIKGFIQAMIDGTIPAENHEKYLNIVLFETERLSGLMTNLLTLNSFDHNKKALERSNFDINYIILKTAETYEGTCMKKKIEFEFHFETEKQIVWADQPRIQQVLNNLIDNALKFSPSYSSIEISTYTKNDKVYISVKDYGIGISSSSINRIWERFYKSDTSRGKDKKGTGLGLAITKEIITSHNENIDVISTEGVGTEFIFTLPPKHLTKIGG